MAALAVQFAIFYIVFTSPQRFAVFLSRIIP
jgi:hypothetical protein